MRAIGLGHRMKAPGGWDLVMMGSGSTRATGKENAAAWNTTTVGTTATTGITAIVPVAPMIAVTPVAVVLPTVVVFHAAAFSFPVHLVDALPSMTRAQP